MNSKRIIDDILRREGSEFTNRASDRGGPTKYGVTQHAWDDYVASHPTRAITRSVEQLTEPAAREFYQVVHVAPFTSRLTDDALAALLADCSVHHGHARTVGWLQAYVGAAQDGRMGPQTAALANSTAGVYAGVLRSRFKFLAKIATDQRHLPGGDPDAVNLAGWINRASEFIR